eukprot:5045117-Heterocapsa_arctica.AAC.1
MSCQELGDLSGAHVASKDGFHGLDEGHLVIHGVRELVPPHEVLSGDTNSLQNGVVRAARRAASKGANGGVVDSRSEVESAWPDVNAL